MFELNIDEFRFCLDVTKRVIETSPEQLTTRQKSELQYFLHEVKRFLEGEEKEALIYLEEHWCFYSEANPAWLALTEREVLAYVGDDLDASTEQRQRAFKAIADCLKSKPSESSKEAFQMLEWSEKQNRMVRI